MEIKKKECVNHLRRNLNTKLLKIRRNTKYPIEIRRLVCNENGLSDIAAFINAAVDYWNGQKDIPFHDKVTKLKTDISNSVNHVLGNHDSCKNS